MGNLLATHPGAFPHPECLKQTAKLTCHREETLVLSQPPKTGSVLLKSFSESIFVERRIPIFMVLKLEENIANVN